MTARLELLFWDKSEQNQELSISADDAWNQYLKQCWEFFEFFQDHNVRSQANYGFDS